VPDDPSIDRLISREAPGEPFPGPGTGGRQLGHRRTAAGNGRVVAAPGLVRRDLPAAIGCHSANASGRRRFAGSPEGYRACVQDERLQRAAEAARRALARTRGVQLSSSTDRVMVRPVRAAWRELEQLVSRRRADTVWRAGRPGT
jgi:hypothetical protein